MLACRSLLTYIGLIKCSCVFRFLDFISVKTFDLHGQDEVTAHHSSLYSENNSNIVIIQFLTLLNITGH